MDLYDYYLTGWNKTLDTALPKFNGYLTVQAHCCGFLDMKAGIKKSRADFEFYLMLR